MPGTTTVFLNGQFQPIESAMIPALDASAQHAVGLFETMLGGLDSAGEPHVRLLGDHLERLDASAKALRLSDSLRITPLGDAVLATIKESGLTRARVRLTITGGDLGAGLRSAGENGSPTRMQPGEPTVMIVAQPATTYPDEMFERGVLATIADARANPLQPLEGHKTVNYWWRLRELQQAAPKGAAEAIVLQVTNHVCGGCVSNLLAVRNGALITPIARGEEAETASATETPNAPSLPSPVLPGITRDAVLRLATRRGLEVHRQMMGVDDLLDADELFLTNSSWGLLPVTSVESRTIGSGAPGMITTDLRSDLEALTASELASK